ncbi:hypothetical protein IGI04_005690 [Brassica rapa subsp. trilocularis]|uniref:Uncharacterized protein n=1 Tax=Brassica rapa subsp. trilocularis TaxID=1813537 RepID=A0ABQ7NGT0_BRACM|nr:hypothetical protein IGI04_005690 [Brassica rapa subsp. trilocularis]
MFISGKFIFVLWPLLVTRKYDVKQSVRKLEGWVGSLEKERLTVEICWKGPKATIGSLRRSVNRDDIKKAVAESEVV